MHRAALAFPIALVAGVLAAGPRLARADAKAEARAHLAKATELHGQGRFAEVLTELTTAYALDPQPDILYAIAQTHVALGDCAQAITFYRRFLSTHPARLPADAAREAIDVCLHTPPPSTTTEPTPPPEEPAPPPPPEPTPPVVAPPPPPAITAPVAPARPHWYDDRLGVSLVGGGVLLGVGAAITYGVARGQLDDAEDAPTYAGYLELVDASHQKRLIASVLAGGALAATAIGAYRLWRHGRAPEVVLVPQGGGGVMSWTGRF